MTLADIKHHFPLPGAYLFRFKARYSKQVVFMDVLKESDKLPHFDQKIVAKVTRLSFSGRKRSTNDTPIDREVSGKGHTTHVKSDAIAHDFSLL